jgi:hypothetical protein
MNGVTIRIHDIRRIQLVHDLGEFAQLYKSVLMVSKGRLFVCAQDITSEVSKASSGLHATLEPSRQTAFI